MPKEKYKKFRKEKERRIDKFEEKQDKLGDLVASDKYVNGRNKFSEFL